MLKKMNRRKPTPDCNGKPGEDFVRGLAPDL